MKASLICVFTICLCLHLYGQSPYKSKPSILYDKETNFGLFLHTRGMGLNFQTDKQIKVNHYRLYDFTIISDRHPKEIKLSNTSSSGVSEGFFTYGKLNSLYAVKLNIGRKIILADRENSNQVRINYVYSVGPVFGLVKPVYYRVRVQNVDNNTWHEEEMKFPEDNQLQQENILGEARVFKGLNEVKIFPGINGKSAISFEWGSDDNRYYSIEGGLNIDAFIAEVPIFAYIKNEQVFPNLYVALTYGFRK